MAETRCEMTVQGVYVHPNDEARQAPNQAQYFVLLSEPGGRKIPLWIGQFEAWAISYALEGDPPERPMTHDMMVMLLETTGATLIEVVIRDVRNEVFYADLTLRLTTGEEKTLDIRPSDALTVALRTKCPIFVAEHVLASAAKAD